MVKKFKIILLFWFVLSILVTVGCNGKLDLGDTDNTSAYPKVDTTEAQKVVEIEFWTWSPIDGIINKFEVENPDIKVKTKTLGYFECKEEYMKALTTENGPDVLMFYSDIFGLYTVDGILQDLLVEPFNARKYQKDFPRWDGGLSLDNKQLLSLTYSTAPQITLYRADVMKENGFPYQPEELAKFLENPYNILTIAEKLKQKSKYIFQWPYDLPNIVGISMGNFDNELNYLRHGEPLNKALKLMKVASSNKMILYGNLWTERGKEAIKNGELVMLLDNNTYSINELEKLVPEQKGLWRLTSPALGVASWQFDNRIAINARSEHKEQAWKFMEYLVTHKSNIMYDNHSIPEYIPARQKIQKAQQTDTYLGNQNISSVFHELANRMVPYKVTPMDDDAANIFGQGIWRAAEQDTDSNEDIKQILEEINKMISEEKTN